MRRNRPGTGVLSRLVLAASALALLTGVIAASPAAAAPNDPPPTGVRLTPPSASEPAGARTAHDTRSTVAPSASFRKVESRLAAAPRTTVVVGLQTIVDGRSFGDPDQRTATRARIASARADLIAANPWLGGRSIRVFNNVPFLSFEVTAAELRQLEQSGKAASVETTTEYKPSLGVSTGTVQSKAAVTHGFDGSGQTVAVLDTGVDESHPFLSGIVPALEACFSTSADCPNGQSTQTGAGAAHFCSFAPDDCRHGTHVAGIAAGRGGPAGVAFNGVAPGAEILPVSIVHRGTDEFGNVRAFTDDLTMAVALDYVMDVLSTGRPIASVNISFGGGVFTEATCQVLQPLRDQIDTLRFWGTPTVISTGNQGGPDGNGAITGVSSPACYAGAVAVSSTDNGTTNPSLFANTHDETDLIAPGGGINSSVPGGGYETWSGTSMAAPHVAGAWAIYKERYNAATDVTAIQSRFAATGTRITETRLTPALVRTRIDVEGATNGWGFVFGHDTTNPDYVPLSAFSANSTGGTNRITRAGTGAYIVKMPGLGSGDSNSGPFAAGNVQVTAYGVAVHRCKSGGAYRNGQELQIAVYCHTPAGAPTDAPFTLMYHSNEAVRTNQAAYVTAEYPSTASYTPNPLEQANSKGGLNTVTRTAAGSYTVTFPGFSTTASGTVQVTAVGSDADYCKVQGWTGTTATVRCYTPAGVLADSQFALSYNQNAALSTLNPANTQTIRQGAYVRADNPTSTAWYTPTAAFRWKTGTGTIQAHKVGTGNYEVKIPGMTAVNATNVLVTAYGTTADTCRVWGWSQSGSDTIVGVLCQTPAGAGVDSTFTVNYTTNLP